MTTKLLSLMYYSNIEADNGNGIANLFKTYFSSVYSNTTKHINSTNNFTIPSNTTDPITLIDIFCFIIIFIIFRIFSMNYGL